MLRLENIKVKFGNKTIFEKMNQNFQKGKIYCVLGKSGKGKTTLLRLLSGLLKPSEGKAYFNDKEITKPNPDIFMMHQNYTNFPWKNSVENVLFPVQLKRHLQKEDIAEALNMLEMVGLKDAQEKFPGELSGGMNQRLALARVLMTKPSVILMDEPLSALDEKTREDMQDLILRLHKETNNTILMVTHSKKEAQKMSDYIINL